jgi:hypothetical protein
MADKAGKSGAINLANLAKLAGRSGTLDGRLSTPCGRRGRDHYILGQRDLRFFSKTAI